MLVDAGAAGDGQAMADTDPRPNATRTAGAWIADYVASRGVSRLDYVVLTHFHADHIGGLHDVGARLPIGTVIDRGHDYLDACRRRSDVHGLPCVSPGAERARDDAGGDPRRPRGSDRVAARSCRVPDGRSPQRRRQRRRVERARRRGHAHLSAAGLADRRGSSVGKHVQHRPASALRPVFALHRRRHARRAGRRRSRVAVGRDGRRARDWSDRRSRRQSPRFDRSRERSLSRRRFARP